LPDQPFTFVRVERPADVPPPDPSTIDVAILDMNHGAPNVGHDAIVAIVRDIAQERAAAGRSARRVRAISYAVRDKMMVPRHDGRHRLYLGTGGPGHLDPRENRAADGDAEIVEDPSWEAPLWALFDAIAADPDASLYGVCHTFGLLCRWSGAARPVKRGPEKGGKMSGVGSVVLTEEALAHPWFARLGAQGDAERRVPVLDSRHYDLIAPAALPAQVTPIAYEALAEGGAGDALTMVEFARDGASQPRIFAVNSHPEIGAADRVGELLEHMLRNGAITPEVFEARSAVLPLLRDDRSARRLAVARTVFDDLARAQIERIAGDA
jgi:hypothetical protein